MENQNQLKQVAFPASNKEQMLRLVNLDRFHTLTASGEIKAVNTTSDVMIQNKGNTAWVTDIHLIVRDSEGKNILEADRRGGISIDDLRVFINIDSKDFTDRSIPLSALSTRDDNKELHSGFRIPPHAKMLFRFESKELASGKAYCKYPLRFEVTLKYYELGN